MRSCYAASEMVVKVQVLREEEALPGRPGRRPLEIPHIPEVAAAAMETGSFEKDLRLILSVFRPTQAYLALGVERTALWKWRRMGVLPRDPAIYGAVRKWADGIRKARSS